MARAVLAFDKFRGTATAQELVEAARLVAEAAGWETTCLPMADGGEGSLEALGGPNRNSVVKGPNGDPVTAAWRLYQTVAYIEMARASGLETAGGANENDPLAADSFGTGQLIVQALDLGAKTIYVLMGGSACTDGGWGALSAMPSRAALKQVDLVAAVDVQTTFVDSAPVFAPQKGASPAEVRLLTRRLERLVQVYDKEYGIDVSEVDGAGAAGGLAGALLAVGGRLESGFDVVAEANDLDLSCAGADLVITGEGYLDAQSFEGKVVGGVSRLARLEGVPTLVVVGDREPRLEIPQGVEVISLTEVFGRSAALRQTTELVGRVVSDCLSKI